MLNGANAQKASLISLGVLMHKHPVVQFRHIEGICFAQFYMSSLLCFILFIPLFIKMDARHHIIAPPSSLK